MDLSHLHLRQKHYKKPKKHKTMRMTKSLAQTISLKLTEKKQKEVQVLEKQFNDEVEKVYIKTIPKEVMAFYKKHPDFVEVSSNVKLHGNGWNWTYVKLSKQYPCKTNSDIVFTAENLNYFFKLKTQVEAKRKEYNDLFLEIQTALEGLRTFALVEKHFPEAAKFLPKSETLAIAINLDSIRSKIK